MNIRQAITLSILAALLYLQDVSHGWALCLAELGALFTLINIAREYCNYGDERRRLNAKLDKGLIASVVILTVGMMVGIITNYKLGINLSLGGCICLACYADLVEPTERDLIVSLSKKMNRVLEAVYDSQEGEKGAIPIEENTDQQQDPGKQDP